MNDFHETDECNKSRVVDQSYMTLQDKRLQCIYPDDIHLFRTFFLRTASKINILYQVDGMIEWRAIMSYFELKKMFNELKKNIIINFDDNSISNHIFFQIIMIV